MTDTAVAIVTPSSGEKRRAETEIAKPNNRRQRMASSSSKQDEKLSDDDVDAAYENFMNAIVSWDDPSFTARYYRPGFLGRKYSYADYEGTALHWAMLMGRPENVAYLMTLEGHDPSLLNNHKETVFVLAASFYHDPDLLKKMIDKWHPDASLLDLPDRDGYSAVARCVAHNRAGSLELLLGLGASLTFPGLRKGQNLLDIAFLNDSWACARLLLGHPGFKFDYDAMRAKYKSDNLDEYDFEVFTGDNNTTPNNDIIGEGGKPKRIVPASMKDYLHKLRECMRTIAKLLDEHKAALPPPSQHQQTSSSSS